ncbi:MAG: phosphoenolpyruvate--protein phosphotransferase, partial [Candidatus Omnitrophica bacterium]|nr:phosphoenolpyruvate--protein phosphotransferase [Candidatus Omnitrophota bacterium]
MLQGIPAASGVSIGRAYLMDSEEFVIAKRNISPKEIKTELHKFQEGLIKTREELLEIKNRISEEMGSEQAEIFTAHLLVIEDPILINDVVSKIKNDLLGVECVFLEVMKRYINVLSNTNDEYLRERVSDINDVGKRVLRNLLGSKKDYFEMLDENSIVVAYDLSPSDTATMHKKNVRAFCTDIGGKTSHTAIMAKSLEIPAVVGLEVASSKIKNGDVLIVDGTHGKIVINPTAQTLAKYKAEQKKFFEFEKDLAFIKDLPAETIDGKKISLAANIEMPEDVESVIAHNAEGIGLYRTEYFYMNRQGVPGEEELFQAYKTVAEKMKTNSVIVRTLDLGGDKFLSSLHVPREMNPFMGWRAIRFCLARPDIFKTQLRAILRASAYGNLKLMYPMISGLAELRSANKMLNEVREELHRESIPFDEKMEIGAMIEVPSAAIASDLLAAEVDFFSIGTNDLIQYALAVDRVNEKIAYLYKSSHPSVLRLIKMIIDNAHKKNIWVGMCGEMAGDPLFTILLLGMDLDHFSMSPVNLLEIKKIVRSVTYSDAKKFAKKVLSLKTTIEIDDIIHKKLRDVLPDMMVDV